MNQKIQEMYIQNKDHLYTHPLHGATAHLIRIMTMAAKDIEDMCNEKAAEWPEEQR